MTSPDHLQETVERVEAYLDHLPLMGGLDHEQIHAIGCGGEMFYLYASDVRKLLQQAADR